MLPIDQPPESWFVGHLKPFFDNIGHLRRRGLSSVTMTRQVWPGSGREFNGLESVRRTLVLLSNW